MADKITAWADISTTYVTRPTTTALCPTWSQIKSATKSNYTASIKSTYGTIANNQLVPYPALVFTLKLGMVTVSTQKSLGTNISITNTTIAGYTGNYIFNGSSINDYMNFLDSHVDNTMTLGSYNATGSNTASYNYWEIYLSYGTAWKAGYYHFTLTNNQNYILYFYLSPSQVTTLNNGTNVVNVTTNYVGPVTNT
jgi:hypothetical protein